MTRGARLTRRRRIIAFVFLLLLTVAGIFWPLLVPGDGGGWTEVVGDSTPILELVVALSVLQFVLANLWPRMFREKRPGMPVVFEPPPGLGPAQTVYCATESVGRRVVAATFTHLSDLGLVEIKSVPDEPLVIVRTADDNAWQTADEVSRWIAESIGLPSQGSQFRFERDRQVVRIVNETSVHALLRLRKWAVAAGYSRMGGLQNVGWKTWCLSLVIALVLFTTVFGNPTIYSLVFAAFVLGGFGLTKIGYRFVRTASGRKLWSQAGGFERFLATPSSEDRHLYAVENAFKPEHLAYALAFDVIGNWKDMFLTNPGILNSAYSQVADIDDAVPSEPG